MALVFDNFLTYSARQKKQEEEQKAQEQAREKLKKRIILAINNFREELDLKDDKKVEMRIIGWNEQLSTEEYNKMKEECGAERIINDDRTWWGDVANKRNIILNKAEILKKYSEAQLKMAQDELLKDEANALGIVDSKMAVLLPNTTMLVLDEGDYRWEYNFKEPKHTKYLQKEGIIIHFNF